MKPRFYLYLVVIVILVILAAVLAKSGPNVESQVAAACLQSGGTFDVSNKTCNMKPVATTAPVVKSSGKPAATPSITPKQEAKYYPIHVISNGQSVYYSSTTTSSMIKVSNPPMNSSILSPATLTGVARGTWYFEATAPVLVTDAKGKILAEGYVTAQNNWMTTEFVPFIGTLSYPAQPSGSLGVLVFRNDNPSGLPSRDQAVEVLVKFK